MIGRSLTGTEAFQTCHCSEGAARVATPTTCRSTTATRASRGPRAITTVNGARIRFHARIERRSTAANRSGQRLIAHAFEFIAPEAAPERQLLASLDGDENEPARAPAGEFGA